MKRIIIFVLTAVILLSMGGCTKKKADNTVEVFCLNMDVTSSVPESYVLRSKNSDVDKQVDELLGRLQDKPEDSRLRKAIPDEVSVRGHDEKNYNCTVDFSKEYYDLTAAQEVLLRASVVRTLTQLDSISYVTFTVNSIPLVDSDDEIVGSMGADDFVENPGEQINTSVKETLTLYFADKDGTGLEKQTRATLPGTTKLINVSVADRICYLNFDSSFRNTIDNKLTEDVVLYSIVNSLTSLPTVDKVQISLDGENDGMLLYNYKLSDMYEFNKDIVDSNDSTEKTEK